MADEVVFDDTDVEALEPTQTDNSVQAFDGEQPDEDEVAALLAELAEEADE